MLAHTWWVISNLCEILKCALLCPRSVESVTYGLSNLELEWCSRLNCSCGSSPSGLWMKEPIKQLGPNSLLRENSKSLISKALYIILGWTLPWGLTGSIVFTFSIPRLSLMQFPNSLNVLCMWRETWTSLFTVHIAKYKNSRINWL